MYYYYNTYYITWLLLIIVFFIECTKQSTKKGKDQHLNQVWYTTIINKTFYLSQKAIEPWTQLHPHQANASYINYHILIIHTDQHQIGPTYA